jgi:hypothetical protein
MASLRLVETVPAHQLTLGERWEYEGWNNSTGWTGAWRNGDVRVSGYSVRRKGEYGFYTEHLFDVEPPRPGRSWHDVADDFLAGFRKHGLEIGVDGIRRLVSGMWESIPLDPGEDRGTDPVADWRPTYEDPLPTYSIAELMAEPDQMSWTHKGWWAHPSYGMQAGAEKTLKSWLDLIETVSLAAGLPLFGRFECVSPGPVLVFSGEGSRRLYMRRARHVARSLGLSDEQIAALPITVIDQVRPILSRAFQQTLAGELDRGFGTEHVPYVKVTLDPLYSYHGSQANAGNLHEVAEILNALSEPVMNAGASLKVVNHFNKQGADRLSLASITQAGSREWVDSWVLVAKRKGGDPSANDFRLRLRVGSRQWGERDWDLDLKLGAFNEDTFAYEGTASWSIVEAVDDAEAGKEAQQTSDLFALRQLNQPFAVADAMAVLGSDTTTRRKLRVLAANGDIRLVQDEVGKALLYEFPTPASALSAVPPDADE